VLVRRDNVHPPKPQTLCDEVGVNNSAKALLQRPTGIVSHQAFHRDPRTRCAQPPSCISLAHHVNTEGQMGKPQTIVLNREARRRPS
jgi:hypothetical protein